MPAAGDPNRADELEVANAIANYMDNQLRNGTFQGGESEQEFEDHLWQELQYRFEDRDDVYRQMHSGGGRVDILVLGVPMELKVLRSGEQDDFCRESLPQATQYVASRGRRVGFLVVLDLRSRTNATPAPVDDVMVMQGPTARGLSPSPDGTLAVVVAFVRARVARPSALKGSA